MKKQVSMVLQIVLVLLVVLLELAQSQPAIPGTVNITTANFTYHPNPVIVAFHGAPHIYRGQLISNPVFTYSPTNSSAAAEKIYFESLLPFPAIIGLIGILCIIGMELGIHDYFTWLVPKLGPSSLEDEDEAICAIALYTHRNEVARKNWLMYFCIALGVAMLGTNLMWVGDYMFEQGFSVFSKELENIAGLVFGISENVISLTTDLDDCFQQAMQASATTCPQVSDVIPHINILYAQINDYAGEVREIAAFTDQAHDALVTVAVRKDWVLYVFYGLSMLALLAFFAAYWTTQSSWMRAVIISSEVLMVVLACLAAFEMLVMMGMSDFCMQPTESVVNSLQGTGVIQQLAKYYSTCHGLNPMHRSLAQSYADRDIVGHMLMDLFNPALAHPACISDPTVIKSYRSLQAMYSTYESLATEMACSAIHPMYARIFTIALCTNTMGGVLGLYISGYVMAFGLFLVAITASVLMLYFDEHWHLEQNMEEKVREIREKQSLLGSSETSGGSDADDALVRSASGTNFSGV